jgi:phage terminase small subunit
MTSKQKLFVEEYLVDLNATQAAIRSGYSSRRASDIGHQLLQKTTVSGAVARALAERSRRTGIVQDRVLLELARIAFVNPADVIDFCVGQIRLDAKADDLAAIAEIRVKQSSTATEYVVKFFDKLRALEILMKHLQVFQPEYDSNIEKAGVILLPEIPELSKPTDE